MARIGRPPLPPDQRKDRVLPFRCNDGLYERLVRAAVANGRTVSQELEQRVVRSFVINALGHAQQVAENFNPEPERITPNQELMGHFEQLAGRVEQLEKITRRDHELLENIGRRVWDLTHEPERVEEARRALDFRGRARKKDGAA